MVPRPLAVLLWRALALGCVVLGLVGVLVPVLPTVPFLIVAAWAGGRGWPALERWLVEHPRWGPGIRGWRERGVVPRRAKWASSGMMLLSAGVLWWSSAPQAVKFGVPLLMAAVAWWLWQRPET